MPVVFRMVPCSYSSLFVCLCSNGDFLIVEYTGIKILKVWISSYIESSLYIFVKSVFVALKIIVFTPWNSMFRSASQLQMA